VYIAPRAIQGRSIHALGDLPRLRPNRRLDRLLLDLNFT
jgi:hypothetical protein